MNTLQEHVCYRFVWFRPAQGTKGGRAIAQAVSRLLLAAEVLLRSQDSLCGICDGQSGSDIGFSPCP
jgi:hypothetical protein